MNELLLIAAIISFAGAVAGGLLVRGFDAHGAPPQEATGPAPESTPAPAPEAAA
jgi:hypothetical protein